MPARMDADDVALPHRTSKSKSKASWRGTRKFSLLGGAAELINTTGQQVIHTTRPPLEDPRNQILDAALQPDVPAEAVTL